MANHDARDLSNAVQAEHAAFDSNKSLANDVKPAAYQENAEDIPGPPVPDDDSGYEVDSTPSLNSPFNDLEDSGAETGLSDGALTTNQQVAALSLGDFQAIAVQNSPTVQHSAARVNSAIGQQIQAGLYPNPTIGYHAVNIGNRGTAGRQAGFIQQRFVTGGKLELDQHIAGHEIQNQQALFTAARQRVLTDVRSRFYEALVAQRREELAGELVMIATNLQSSTEKLLKAEQASENTLLQAEIEVEQARILKENATNEYHEAWRQLAVVAGTPDLPVSKLSGQLEGDFDQHDLESLTVNLLQSHPLVVAARSRIEKAAHRIDRAQREVIPDITFLADAADTNHTGYNTAQARLGIELPLWDKNQGNIHSAQAELAAARAERRRIELQLRQRLTEVYRRYSNALHQMTRYRDSILPKAKRSLKLVRKGYENGQVEYQTLLNSQQRFVQVNLAYTDSLEQLQTSVALLDGRLLTGSLEAD